ncbi:MAG: hypothetical protein N2578_06755, partial [Bdellovibrionaceae bacterium]|nr:hypothetical protein [Pseudobdellovibrionaceae bacterium]
ILMILFSACQTLKGLFGSNDEAVLSEIKERDRLEIQALSELLMNGLYEQALAGLAEFQKERPDSVYFLESRLMEAEALISLERSSEAAQLLRDITRGSHIDSRKIRARGHFLLALVEDSLGQEDKAIAELKSAELLADALPPQVARAELPARFAVIYAKQGHLDLAEIKAEEASRGIQAIMSSPELKSNRTWAAKTWFEMGRTSFDQISPEVYFRHIRALSLAQTFLVRSVALDADTWSGRAAKLLITGHRSLWQQVLALHPTPENLEVRKKMALEYNEVARAFLSLATSMQEAGSTSLDQPVAFVKETERASRELAFTPHFPTRMTEESLNRGSVFKNLKMTYPYKGRKNDGN